MPRPSLLTDEQKLQLRRHALTAQKRGLYFRRPSTPDLCAYAAREFGVSYGERGMAKIMVSLGLVWVRHINAWQEPRR
jgi:transposase